MERDGVLMWLMNSSQLTACLGVVVEVEVFRVLLLLVVGVVVLSRSLDLICLNK